jgi:hypothetical protein
MPKIKFTVDAALLRELGERLVGQPHVALAELIKNSYDADAAAVEVRIEPGRIEVSDNGQGMTLSEFKRFWMRIGSPTDDVRLFEDPDVAGLRATSPFSGRTTHTATTTSTLVAHESMRDAIPDRVHVDERVERHTPPQPLSASRQDPDRQRPERSALVSNREIQSIRATAGLC